MFTHGMFRTPRASNEVESVGFILKYSRRDENEDVTFALPMLD